MKGGKRAGAGRNTLPIDAKKKGYKIYVNEQDKKNIEKFGVGETFSQKCTELMANQISIRKKENPIKFIDLFAGLGGIRIGFTNGLRSKGYTAECVFSCEIKDYAIRSYKKYFNEEKIFGDITKVCVEEIGKFDFLLAGFPCQPFSSAGKGLGFEDTRGTLFFEIERILSYWKPFGFLLENVEGLINHDQGRTLEIIIGHLKDLGYHVSYNLLDGQHFGLAQSRKRVYIVGTQFAEVPLTGFDTKQAAIRDIQEYGYPSIDNKFTKALKKHYPIELLAGMQIKDKRGGKNNVHSWDLEIKGKTSPRQRDLLNTLLKERRKKHWAEEIGIDWMDGMPLTKEQIQTFFDDPNLQELLDDLVKKGYLAYEHPKKLVGKIRISDSTKAKGYNIIAGKLSFDFSKILDPEGVAPTLVATDVSKLGIIDGKGIRRLTVREGLRMFGFPEDYDLSFLKYSEAFDLLGNTVCIPVIEAIAERIADYLT